MNFRSLPAFFLLVILASCSEKSKIAPTPPPINVTDYVVEPKTIPAVFDFVGFAESSHLVEIRARVEGYLEKIAYDEGQIVQAGDLLFQLDPRQYEAKVEQAKAEVAKQNALLQNAILTVNRLTPLYEKKAASKKDLDNATANKLASEASLLAAKAQLLDSEINLGYTTILSPITGSADKAKLREGALINPASNSLLTTVSVLDPIWVYFTISDTDILRANQQTADKSIILPKENQYTIKIIFSDGTTYPHIGKVDFSSPTYDQSTGTIQARAVFPNPTGDIRPGQFVRVKVYGAERPDAIIVPRRALMQKKNGMFVYLIEKDFKIISQDVSTADWYEDYQIITNGLKAGDRIVVDGINKVAPGMIVNIIGPWKPLATTTPTSSSNGMNQ
ncbi:MAG: efflux RND transporter periplasmic adaptor subunit [Parachlamydiaceae bacterium]|nr:efflux RND transporter periplasmic adaptor subunit [Parachlamydiaceae bacterium]